MVTDIIQEIPVSFQNDLITLCNEMKVEIELMQWRSKVNRDFVMNNIPLSCTWDKIPVFELEVMVKATTQNAIDFVVYTIDTHRVNIDKLNQNMMLVGV